MARLSPARLAQQMRSRLLAVCIAARHPGVPRLPRLLAVALLAYALSPLDLIPDFVPVLGYLDDVLILGLGIAMVIRLVPPAVWQECLARAGTELRVSRRARLVASVLIAGLWLLLLWWVYRLVLR